MTPAICELDAADIPEACQLFQNVFGSAITPEHWRWKYLQGPRLGGINLIARGANGELLAHTGGSVFPGVIGGASRSMVPLSDFMVDSAARGAYSLSTVYPRLMRAMQETVLARYAEPYAYGFAGVRQFKLGIRLGYYRVLQHYRPAYFAPAASAASGSALWRASCVDWDSARLDKIWSRRVSEIRCPTILRTGAYLAWRYRDHPVHGYRLWMLSHLSRDRGWFITRAMPNGEICVVDALLPATANPSELMAVLARAIASAAPVLPPIYSWLLQSDAGSTVEPVVGGEFKLARWHSDEPNPAFQPGDTDVF